MGVSVEVKTEVNFEELYSKEIIVAPNCIRGDKNHFVNYLRKAFQKTKAKSKLYMYAGSLFFVCPNSDIMRVGKHRL